SLLYPLETSAAHLVEMLGHDVRNRVLERLFFELPRDPSAFRPIQERLNGWLLFAQRPIIEVRRIVQVTRASHCVELYVEHSFRDCPALSRAREARILDGVLQVKDYARRHA